MFHLCDNSDSLSAAVAAGAVISFDDHRELQTADLQFDGSDSSLGAKTQTLNSVNYSINSLLPGMSKVFPFFVTLVKEKQ